LFSSRWDEGKARKRPNKDEACPGLVRALVAIRVKIRRSVKQPRRSAALRRALVLATCAALALPAPHPARAAGDDATAHHRFEDAAAWSKVFDDPARDAWQKPEEVVRELGQRPGASVADLGAGTGYFSRPLSAAVGVNGTVYAVEVEPSLVAHLRERAEREGTANLVPVLASLDNPRLPAASVDAVLVVDTYHHIDDRVAYFGRLRRALRPGGTVAIVDFEKRDLPVGPPPEHKLPREQVIDEMDRAGYRLDRAPAILPYQYVLVFAPR
jgi:predicted methyltransferase